MKRHNGKVDIVKALISHKNAYVSGQDLGRKLSISRVAVHKKVENLTLMGFDIERKRKWGYRLVGIPNKPVKPLVEYEFEEKGIQDIDYHYFEEVESVQDIAIREARKKIADWTVFCASRQTRGRGRFERKWISPCGGLWMSVVFSPGVYLNKAAAIGVAGAYFVADTLRNEYGINAFVKWPNDVILNEKKVGGILITSISEGELIVKAIMGIGLNVNFKSSLIGKAIYPASTILEETGKELFLPELLALILRKIKIEMEDMLKDTRELKDKVEKMMWKKGQEVTLRMPDESFIFGRIKGLDEDCFLVLSTPSGEEKVLSGEFI